MGIRKPVQASSKTEKRDNGVFFAADRGSTNAKPGRTAFFQPPRLSSVHGSTSNPVIQRFTDLDFECTTFRGACREGSAELQDSREAMRRMNDTPVGQQLLEDLRTNRKLENSTIKARFATNVNLTEQGIDGKFIPPQIGAPEYQVFVDLNAHQSRGTADRQPLEQPTPSGPSYGGGRVQIPTYVVERPSMIAETLFHELLHVWYLNTFGHLGLGHRNSPRFGTAPFTGHGDASLGEIEAPFATRLRNFAMQIYRVESTPPPAPPPSASAEAPPPPVAPAGPTPPRREHEEPSLHGFQAGFRASYFNLPMPGITADQFGMDFSVGYTYGSTVRFGVNGQALYLPEAGMFGLGGNVGVRFYQGGDAPGGLAPYPIFFDINAGAIYVLSPERAMITSNAGIGMDVGNINQWRFFWEASGGIGIMPMPTGGPVVGGTGGLTLGVAR